MQVREYMLSLEANARKLAVETPYAFKDCIWALEQCEGQVKVAESLLLYHTISGVWVDPIILREYELVGEPGEVLDMFNLSFTGHIIKVNDQARKLTAAISEMLEPLRRCICGRCTTNNPSCNPQRHR